jgi:ATP-dependent Clp protease ATP-binding subunit ClpC
MRRQETFTTQAIACVEYATHIATLHNQRTISGDNLFWGIFAFMQQQKHFWLLCNLLSLRNAIESLTIYYEDMYADSLESISFEQKKILPFNKKIENKIWPYVSVDSSKLDFLTLFFVSFFDLSNETIAYCKEQHIDLEIIKNNCDMILQNNAVKTIGLFAFLEIMHKMFRKLHLDPNTIQIMQIEKIDNLQQIHMMLDTVESEIVDKDGIASGKKEDKEEKKLTVEYFGTDLTKEYTEGFIDPIIWREKEIDQVIYTLLRKNKNNPLLIGEAGVGKTAIVEWLAQRMAKWEVPEKLKDKKIMMLDMGSVVAGTKYRWEFEARMKSILDEATDPVNNIILFIDELHTIIGAWWQENNDAAQMIKPLLARGKIKLIWATTYDEYQKHIEKDAALKRRFQEVMVDEPDATTTEAIMQGLKQTYEDFHGVKIEDASIAAAIKLSKRYMLNKHLPDKALDIIDEACAKKSTLTQKLENDDSYKEAMHQIKKIEAKIETAIEKQDYFKAAELKEQEENLKKNIAKLRTSKNVPLHLRPVITIDDVWGVLADKAGIPVNIVTESEIEKLKRLETELTSNIFWQEEAVKAIVRSLTRNRLSVVEKDKPIGSFLFLGPTGVGKTHLAKLVAKIYFGDEKSMIRVDMSEFMEKYSISKLIGSPAGYVGYEEWGNLTEAVRRKPYSVILFDEIEKASPDVLNILLQILDEWHLKDAKGRIIDFKSTIIIMTSNLGAEEFGKKQARIWFAGESTEQEISDRNFVDIKDRVMVQVKDHMTPEMLNRIDHTVIFKPLSKQIVTDIFTKKVKEFLTIWSEKTHIKVPKFTKKKIDDIVEKIYDPAYGARPLDRYIHDEIEPELIEQVMNQH